MKKFSSFGRLFNQRPTIIMQNSLDETSENNQNTQADFADLSKNNDMQQNEGSDTPTNKDFLHYPQSNYDFLEQAKTQKNQNMQNDLQKNQIATSSSDVQNDLQKNQSTTSSSDVPTLQDNDVLSQKARTLLECMRQHDNIVRNIKK